ncbi:hypothetical protein [Methanimicrococcus hacksteinii]|uniref:hypothetical protein n=1 Tax=Methanimicrococcus hacksteinii TaxID=3028293 RepID=UPI00298F371F|nr:hypothetical protein [Methanimicrococcus sp. At1]
MFHAAHFFFNISKKQKAKTKYKKQKAKTESKNKIQKQNTKTENKNRKQKQKTGCFKLQYFKLKRNNEIKKK